VEGNLQKRNGHPFQPGRECWGGRPARCHRLRGPGVGCPGCI